MHVWATILGAAIIFGILLDAFETIVLPRRVQRGFRLTAFFYRNTCGRPLLIGRLAIGSSVDRGALWRQEMLIAR